MIKRLIVNIAIAAALIFAQGCSTVEKLIDNFKSVDINIEAQEENDGSVQEEDEQKEK